MKSHELLDLIGEAGEDYVLAADSNVIRPHFRWRTWAVCAACAALVLGIGLNWRADWTGLSTVGADSNAVADEPTSMEAAPESDEAAPEPEPTLVEIPGLHPYTQVEGTRQIALTASADEPGAPIPDAAAGGVDPGQDTAGTNSFEIEGAVYGEFSDEFSGDYPAQEAADEQYRRLLLWLFGTDAPGWQVQYPEWFGGVWTDNDYWPEARLAVAIVDSFHTPGLEQQISAQCGGTQALLFPSVKYSQNELVELMDKIRQVFDELNCRSCLVYGLDVMENRITMDFSDTPSDEVLAALAELDPDGDAIFIQVFIGAQVRFTDEAAKPPEPFASSAAPGGSTAPETALSVPPESLPGNPEDLPEAKYGAGEE